MLSRTVTRAAARSAARAPLRNSQKQIRFATTSSSSTASSSPINSHALIGGLAGGSLVFLAGYGYYHTSGAKSLVNTATATKNELRSLTDKITSSAPPANEALKRLRSTASSYAAFIPGAKGYVDSAFNDLDKVQAKHGKEVEEIVNKAYEELKSTAKKEGLSMTSAAKSWEIVEGAMKELASLASDSASEILDNHPELKEKVGGNLDQLKGMADRYGPEAKKELEDTYQQIKDVLKAGISFDTVDKIKKVVDEKTKKVGGMGEEAWKKGLESAKPYLEKNPQIKKVVEENSDALKKGNVTEALKKISEALYSGNADSLKDYVKQAGEKAQKTTGIDLGNFDLEKYAKMIPGGQEILPKLQKLQEVAKSHGEDAEKILKGAYKDVQDVLQKRIAEAEKLAEKAGKDAKKETKK